MADSPTSRRSSTSKARSSNIKPLAIGQQPSTAAAKSKASSGPIRTSSSAVAPQRVPLPNAAAVAPPAKPTAAQITTLPQRPLPPLSVVTPSYTPSTMNVAISPAASMEMPKISMTSKEWIIPPRPKPGRKPATDTPPTKRKAQNRAAQRAFRERRAARVGELEEQLDQQKEVHDTHESDLKDRIRSLELDVQSFRSRCLLLENMLDRERQERIRTETEAETLRQRLNDAQYRRDSNMSMLPHQLGMSQHRDSFASNRLPKPRPSKDLSISQMISPPDSVETPSANESSAEHITCGGCSPAGRCACAEQVLSASASGCGKCEFGSQCECLEDISRSAMHIGELKRPSSSSECASAGKRQKAGSRSVMNAETDFTAFFARNHSAMETSQNSQLPPSAMMSQMSPMDAAAFKESCGFCKDGTYCACADAAMATPAMTPPETTPSLPTQVETPPPSEAEIIAPPPFIMEMTADGAVKLPPRKKRAVGISATSQPAQGAQGSKCGANGPGTCAQCQADPKSGLFCRLMSAKFGGSSGPGGGGGGGCCGGKGAGGGCCKTKPPPIPEEKVTLPSLPSLGLTCAEAYQTLASHRNFDKASDDIGSWLPKLRATPRPGERAVKTGRMAVEVEAASIMSVLKEFDIRFGREC